MEYVEYTHINKTVWETKLIQCYKQVFAAPPWNEDWWTDELVREVLERYAGPNAKIILAVVEDEVVGFAWGALWRSADLAAELDLSLPYESELMLGYIKDVGVIEAFRQSGVAKTLLNKLLLSLQSECSSKSYVLARTLAHPKPSVIYKWFPRLGFVVVAEYAKEHERFGQVVLSCPTSHVSF